jgi:hypothetical protein
LKDFSSSFSSSSSSSSSLFSISYFATFSMASSESLIGFIVVGSCFTSAPIISARHRNNRIATSFLLVDIQGAVAIREAYDYDFETSFFIKASCLIELAKAKSDESND